MDHQMALSMVAAAVRIASRARQHEIDRGQQSTRMSPKDYHSLASNTLLTVHARSTLTETTQLAPACAPRAPATSRRPRHAQTRLMLACATTCSIAMAKSGPNAGQHAFPACPGSFAHPLPQCWGDMGARHASAMAHSKGRKLCPAAPRSNVYDKRHCSACRQMAACRGCNTAACSSPMSAPSGCA